MTFVLILLLATSSPNFASMVSMQEFQSQQSCEMARDLIKKTVSNQIILLSCVPK